MGVRRGQEAQDGVQKWRDADILQRRAGEHGIDLPLFRQRRQLLLRLRRRDGLAVQVALHQRLVRLREGLDQLLLPLGAGGARAQAAVDLLERSLDIRALTVDLVEKEDHRQLLGAQGLEEQLGLRLHALGSAHDDHRAVQRPERAFDLRGEVDVAGRIDQVDVHVPPLEAHAGRPHGDAAPLLHGQVVRVGRATVHAARLAHRPGVHQKLLGQGGLARVHVREYADVSQAHLFASRIPPWVVKEYLHHSRCERACQGESAPRSSPVF